MMHTVLPREEAVEAIFSKIVASPASCEQLREVVYEHLEDEQIFEKNQAEHFTEVLFQAYKNGDISALLLEICFPEKRRRFRGESTRSSEILISYMSVHPVQKYIWQMDMI